MKREQGMPFAYLPLDRFYDGSRTTHLERKAQVNCKRNNLIGNKINCGDLKENGPIQPIEYFLCDMT